MENFCDFIFEDEFVKVAFTSKFGGVSKGCFSSLNLSLNVEDKASLVLQNREILREKFGAKELVFMNQIHSDRVENFSQNGQILESCDAVFSSLLGVGLCALAADCYPILIYDKIQKKIAAIHAGRAGVLLKIFTKTFNAMQSNPNNILVFVGPAIKGNCYEIRGIDLMEFNRYKIDNKFMIEKALLDEILACGIEKINFSKICTHCDESYFSYRRDGKTGRFCGIIMLKNN